MINLVMVNVNSEGMCPIVGTFNSTDNFDVWIEMEISYLVSSCKSSRSSSEILIQVEMQKIYEVKVKILFLSKLIHRPFQLCTILNLEWSMYSST